MDEEWFMAPKIPQFEGGKGPAPHPLFGPIPPPVSRSIRPLPKNSFCAPPPPPPPPPPPSPSTTSASLAKHPQRESVEDCSHPTLPNVLLPSQLPSLTIRSTDDLKKISQNDCTVSIPSSGCRMTTGKLSAAKNSCCCESGSHLYNQTDTAWYTPKGNPMEGNDADSMRLGSESDIELARPDIFFGPSILEGLDARYIVVYQTPLYKKGESQHVAQNVVLWKRSFATCDQALAEYLNGAKQGWSIPFAYAEISIQKLHKKKLEKAELAGLHCIELDDGRAVTCGHSAALTQHHEMFACPYCNHGSFHQDGALYSHVRDNHKAEIHAVDTFPLFWKLLRDEALQKANGISPVCHQPLTGASLDLTRLGFQKTFPHLSDQDAWSTASRSMVPETGSQMIEEDAETSEELPDGPRNRQNPRLSLECQSTVKDPHTWHQDQPSYHVQQRDAPRESASYNTPASSLSALPHSTISHPVPDQTRTLLLAENEQSPAMVLQPDSRPISQEHLTKEVKTIYAALAMVESKCIHVVRTLAAAEHDPSSGQQPNLAQDHWQALIALHRTLLYEHHDFFVASQHPSANLKLRLLADKYSMPARLWKHGIHSFLEILRHRLPESLEYMLTFVSQAYQTMAILYESVPAFEDTWIEYLGDLGRYRMVIEDEDLWGRETWAGVARFWYSKAADKNPAVGRLYHHLAILARPNALQQLYFICRSLICVQPFMSARQSILILFGPTSNASCSHSSPVETSFIRVHAVIFEKDQGTYDTFDRNLTEVLEQLDNRTGRVASRWEEQGGYMAIANLASLFDYGSEDNFLRLAFSAQLQSVVREQIEKSDDLDGPFSHLLPMQPVPDDIKLDVRTTTNFPLACRLTFDMLYVVLQRSGDKNVLTYAHILLAFLYQLAALPYDTSYVLKHVKVEDIACFLNTLARSETVTPAIESPNFLHEGEEHFRPLPEDYLIRGQLWAHSYYPKAWFSGVVDEEERTLELASTIRSRAERILWLGIRLSMQSKFGLKYDSSSHIWCAHR